MSLENDARECLIAGIEDELRQALQPGDLNVAKPSDPDFKCNFVKWRKTLEAACGHMEDRGHDMGNPTNEKARELLDVSMSNSLSYLVKLAKSQMLSAQRRPGLVPALVAFAMTAALAAAYRIFWRGQER